MQESEITVLVYSSSTAAAQSPADGCQLLALTLSPEATGQETLWEWVEGLCKKRKGCVQLATAVWSLNLHLEQEVL